MRSAIGSCRTVVSRFPHRPDQPLTGEQALSWMGPGKGHPVGSAHDVPFLPHAEGQAVEAQFQSASQRPSRSVPIAYDGAELIRVEITGPGLVLQVSGLSIRPELTIWSKGTQPRQCGWRKGRAIFEAPIKFRFYPLKEPLVVAVSPSSSVSLPTGLQGTTCRVFTICCSIHPEGR